MCVWCVCVCPRLGWTLVFDVFVAPVSLLFTSNLLVLLILFVLIEDGERCEFNFSSYISLYRAAAIASDPSDFSVQMPEGVKNFKIISE